MIKKRANENPIDESDSLDIGWLASYVAATAEHLQSKGFGTPTKKRRDTHRGSEPLENRMVSALHSHNDRG